MTTQGTHEMEVNDTPSAALSSTRKRVSMSSTGVMQVTDDGGVTTDVGGGGGSSLPFTTTLYAVPFTAEVNKINRVDGTVPALAIALPLGADGDVIGFLNEYGMNGSMVVTPDVGGPDFIFVPGNLVITINQPPVGAPIVTILRFNGSTKIWLPEDIFLLALSANPRFIPTSSFTSRPNGTAMLDNSLLASTGVGNDIAALVIGDGEFAARSIGGDLGSVTPAQARAMLFPNQTFANAVITTPDATGVAIFSYTTATNDRVIALDLLVEALEPATGDAALFAVSALVYRDGLSSMFVKNVTFLNGPFRDQAAWDVNISVSSPFVDVTVLGEAAKTIEWRVTGRIVEHG